MHIVIIGAGLAGLALSVALQQQQFSTILGWTNNNNNNNHEQDPSTIRGEMITFTVYERDEDIDCRPQGYSLTLQRNGMQILGQLGLRNQIQQLECRCGSNYTYSSNGTALVCFDPKLGNKKSKNIPIPRQHLRKMLYQLLDDREERVVWNKEFKSYEESGDKVIVHFSDGDSAEADLVVGCDGIRSQVRSQKLPQTSLNYLGVWAVNGISTWGTGDQSKYVDSPFNDRVFQTIDGRSRVFVKPYLPGESMWQITFPLEANEIPATFQLPREEVLKIVRDHLSSWEHDMVTDLMDATPLDRLRSAPLYDIDPLAHWTTSRVTLIGDSCHPMSPFKGQGANNALVDVMSLVKSLKNYFDTQAKQKDKEEQQNLLFQELGKFEDEMRHRTRGVVLASRRAVQFYHSDQCMNYGKLCRFLGVTESDAVPKPVQEQQQ